jgi:hypothetical protein
MQRLNGVHAAASIAELNSAGGAHVRANDVHDPATVTDGALPIVATTPELPEVMNSAIGQGRNFDQGT